MIGSGVVAAANLSLQNDSSSAACAGARKALKPILTCWLRSERSLRRSLVSRGRNLPARRSRPRQRRRHHTEAREKASEALASAVWMRTAPRAHRVVLNDLVIVSRGARSSSSLERSCDRERPHILPLPLRLRATVARSRASAECERMAIWSRRFDDMRWVSQNLPPGLRRSVGTQLSGKEAVRESYAGPAAFAEALHGTHFRR